MIVVTIEQAATQLRGLIDRAVRLAPEPCSARRERKAGFAKGLIIHMADDFDAPLDDFREYR